MDGSRQKILGDRHHRPCHEVTFVIRFMAVHPMELRSRIRAPLVQPHAQFMAEGGDQLRPSGMVPNSDFGMADRETQIQQRAVVLWQKRARLPNWPDLVPKKIFCRF